MLYERICISVGRVECFVETPKGLLIDWSCELLGEALWICRGKEVVQLSFRTQCIKQCVQFYIAITVNLLDPEFLFNITSSEWLYQVDFLLQTKSWSYNHVEMREWIPSKRFTKNQEIPSKIKQTHLVLALVDPFGWSSQPAVKNASFEEQNSKAERRQNKWLAPKW